MTLRKREDTGNWKRKHQITSTENSLWKRLWTCHNADNNRMNECDNISSVFYFA
jgi:hypothetical protein